MREELLLYYPHFMDEEMRQRESNFLKIIQLLHGCLNSVQTKQYISVAWDYLLYPATVGHVSPLWNIKIHAISWLVVYPCFLLRENQ